MMSTTGRRTFVATLAASAGAVVLAAANQPNAESASEEWEGQITIDKYHSLKQRGIELRVIDRRGRDITNDCTFAQFDRRYPTIRYAVVLNTNEEGAHYIEHGTLSVRIERGITVVRRARA